MDVQELLEPLTHGPVPDVERVHERFSARRRRRRAVLATGLATVAIVLGAALWLMPGGKASVATVGNPEVDNASAVQHVVETLFLQGPTLDQKLAQIDESTGLDAVVAQGMQDDRAHRLTLTITTIDVNDPIAVAHIEFFLDGATAMSNGQLELTHIEARWLVRRDSYCALIATGGLQCPTTGATSNSDATTVITTHVVNEFNPATRLLDAPIGDVPAVVVVNDGTVTLTFQASPPDLSLKVENASSPAGSVSLSGDPVLAPPLVFGVGSQPDPNLGGPWSYLYGVTRSEVARVEITSPSGVVAVDTVAVAGIPGLRFFLVAYPMPTTPSDSPKLVGYSVDGVRLTDSTQH